MLRFLLALAPDGEPANPAMLVTAIPNWEEGDIAWTGTGEGFRVIGTDPLDEYAHVNGVSGLLVVEPI